MKKVWNPLPRGNCEPYSHRCFIDCQEDMFPCERVGKYGSIGNIVTGYELSEIDKLNKRYDEIIASKCEDCYLSRFCNICAARCHKHTELSVKEKERQCVSEKRWFDIVIKLFLSLKEKVT